MNAEWRLRDLSLRVLAASLLCVLAAWLIGEHLAQSYLPLLRWTYTALDRDHQLTELVISGQAAFRGADHVFKMTVVPDGLILVGTRVVHSNPQGWASASVLIAYLWQPMLAAILAASLWPVASYRELPLRLLFVAVLCVPLSMIDLPFVLWSLVWQNYVQAFAPDLFSPLLIWADFLQQGGRYLLGGVVGVLAAYGAERVVSVRSRADLQPDRRTIAKG